MNEPICSRCIFDAATPNISFDDAGVCNYCRQVESLADQYGTGGVKGTGHFEKLLSDIRASNPDGKYNCVIGVSGGTDSSYLLMKAKREWGLRPLAVHYDNTWNSAIATQNIAKVTKAFDVDLYTYVVNNKEIDDIFRAFFLSGVPELDASTDIAFVQVLRSVAAKFGISYIIEGHSFIEEGVSPQGNNYFDGAYVKDIHQKYGTRKIQTYPNLTFFRFMRWLLTERQVFVRPFWYIDYSKEEAREILQREAGWQYYGGHHLENRLTAFLHTVYNPQKFGIDNRNWSLCAQVRSGKLSRTEALQIYATPPEDEQQLVAYFQKRLGLSEQEYLDTMAGVQRTHRDFKTYKKRFQRLRPFFKIMADREMVPRSFYLKYCFPQKEDS